MLPGPDSYQGGRLPCFWRGYLVRRPFQCLCRASATDVRAITDYFGDMTINTSSFRLVTKLVPFLLLIAGCQTDRDSPQACAYEVGQALDAGQWDLVLEKIDSASCRRGMSSEEREINRAAAYIGRAGYELGDLVDVALSRPEPDDPYPDLRFIRQLGNLGVTPGGLRDLDLSLLAHQQVVSGEEDGSAKLLQQACRQPNVEDLSETGKDACFLAGLFAPARFAKAVTLMLGKEAASWQEDDGLSCEVDRNNSGVIDGAQVTACALSAIGKETNGGICVPATGVTGEVRWETLGDTPLVSFEFDGKTFADLQPVRVVVDPGAECTGMNPRIRYRFISPGEEPSLAVTEGACGRDIRQRCEQVSPDRECWPCPIPRADGTDMLTISNTLLSPVNREAELMLFVLPGVEAVRVADRLEETRKRLCEPAAGTSTACDTREDGATLVRQSALGAYLEQ